MSRVTRILVCLLFGHALIGGLYWALIQVPESTIWMLALSALLVLSIVLVAATVEATGIWWWQGEGWRIALALPSLGRAVIGFALAAIVFLALYWITGLADSFWFGHRGEIDAWMMMRTRSPRTAILHTIAAWIVWFIRYPLALSLSIGLFGTWLQRAPRPRPLAWVREAIGWRPLLGLTIALLIFFVLPWRYVYWRPESLEANWKEAAFVAVKLFAIYLMMNIGWTIVLSAGARERRG